MLSSVLKEQLRATLLNEKQQLEERLHGGVTGEYLSETESVGELSAYDNHPADLGSELFERGKDLALHEQMREDLQEINAALAAMETGQYGTCAVCHQDIPTERLEVLPSTLYCKEHSPEQTVSKSRPIEEEVLGHPFVSHDLDSNVGYDSEDSIQDAMRVGSSDTPSDFITHEEKDYNHTYLNSNENLGYIEDFENFIGTDMYGKEKTIYGVKEYQQYEQKLDEYDQRAIEGTLPTDDFPQ
jgi:YteA family regulatory protein